MKESEYEVCNAEFRLVHGIVMYGLLEKSFIYKLFRYHSIPGF